MPIVAGVDSSTQSCTVQVRDADSGDLLGAASSPHPRTTPPVSEHDARDWWAALVLALPAACADAGVATTHVDAIAIAAQCHGLVAVDHAGEPLRAVKLWNDTTSAAEASAMVAADGAGAWASSVGLVPTAAITITKAAWIAAHEPGLLERAEHLVVPHDYLTWRLTGRWVTDRSDASGTGYFGLDGRWRTSLLRSHVSDTIDWDALLPEVLGPSEAAGHVSPAAAAELGLRRDVVVGAGGGDQHLGALGLGGAHGDVIVSLGTSGVVMAPSPTPVVDPRGWIDSVADAAGGFLPLTCTLNSTKVTDAVAHWLGVGIDELAHMALAADPVGTPTLLAYLDGERTPARPDSRGVLAGLTSGTTREQIARAAFVGVVDGLMMGWGALTEAGIRRTGDVIVTGGGARSDAYLQLLADAFGHPVQVRDADGATARGAAVQASAVLAGDDVKEVADRWLPPVAALVDAREGAADRPDVAYRTLFDIDGAGGFRGATQEDI